MFNMYSVNRVLRERVSPLLRSHGGDLQLCSISGDLVKVRFTGSCHGCPSASETVERVVQAALREEFQNENIEVRVNNEVSDDLIQQAKRILRHEQ